MSATHVLFYLNAGHRRACYKIQTMPTEKILKKGKKNKKDTNFSIILYWANKPTTICHF